LLTFTVSTKAVSGDKLIDAPPTETVDSTVVLTCPHPNLDPSASDLWRGYSVPQGVVAESLDRGERLEAID
jgi:hypothetical protein